jgi:hypothetical protein
VKRDVRLTPGQAEALDAYCERHETTLADLVRDMIARWRAYD